MSTMSSATRAPRGTKILAKAFFAAADEIPEPQRAEVVKAALAVIRDEWKTAREKVAVAKAKAKAKSGKAPATSVRKSVGVIRAKKKLAPIRTKASVKHARKAASKPAERTVPDQSVETAFPSDI